MPRKKGIQRRDADGLTLNMRKVLAALVNHSEWGAAADEVAIPRETVRSWLRSDDSFKRAYDSLYGSVSEIAETLLKRSAETAADALDDIVRNATREEQVKCPYCDRQFGITIENYAVRQQAAKTILQGAGRLVSRSEVHHEVEGTVIHRHELPTAEQLALSAAERGMPIDERMRRRLQDKGFLKEHSGPVIDSPGWRDITEKGASDDSSVSS